MKPDRYTIQGYELSTVIPDCPTNKKQILFWDKDKDGQYWQRPYSLTDYQFLKLSYAEQEDIVEIENERCLNGVWFYNRGVPVYLTGDNYHFLTYHRIDGTIIPDFIWFQTLDFYFQKLCELDDRCYGRIDLKPRREGDTQRKLATATNKAITTEGLFVGIQSKTGKDASEINFGGLLRAFNKLPVWRKPKTRLENPSRELAFEQPPKRSSGKVKTLADVEYEDYYLNSKIDWRATSSDAYDGDKLHIYIMDEYFKWSEGDAYKAWMTHKKCLVDGEDIIGKAYLLSTVGIEEDEGKVTEAALLNGSRLWNESNPNERNSTGQTETGLYRWFIGAHNSRRSKKMGWPDKYGNIPEDDVKMFLMRKRLDEDNPERRMIMIRQEPLNVQEALASMLSNVGVFSSINTRLSERKTELQAFTPTPERPVKYWVGNLAWKNNERFTEVVRVDNEKGRWKIPYLPSVAGMDMFNRVKKLSYGGFSTYADTQFVIGVDPFNYAKTVSGSGSKGAFHVYLKFNFNDRDFSNKFCAHYRYRPASPDLFFEDVLLTAWYYGAKINPERSGSTIFDWFKRNGVYNFLMYRPDVTKNSSFTKSDTEKGTTATKETIEIGCNLTETYFALPDEDKNDNTVDNLQYFWDEETLDQLMEFDHNKREKLDSAMALFHTLIGSQSLKKFTVREQTDSSEKKESFIDYLFPVSN
jgi:hypothetical protein